MKKLLVSFSDGTTWEIDAEPIARQRAEYYAQLDYERGDVSDLEQAIKDEIAFALRDDYEITDWAHNNMDWDDVVGFARLVNSEKANYAKEWSNSDMRIIDEQEG